MAYHYPDIFDLITLSIIESKGLNHEFLEEAENHILSSAEAMFRKQRFNTLLDLGCGDGRLSIKFSKYFDKITALEPDEDRLQNAKHNILREGGLHGNLRKGF